MTWWMNKLQLPGRRVELQLLALQPLALQPLALQQPDA